MSTDTSGGLRAVLTIDRDRCEGHSQCVIVAPDLLHLDA
ncbi:MAG: hypothetical protein E6Q73_14025, partial [Pseudorhodobacter sp.]